MHIRQIVVAILLAGAFAAPANAQRWMEYSVVADKGNCNALPPVFAVTRWQQGNARFVAMQAPSQLWQWQATKQGRIEQVLFWAEDLQQGVSFTHLLELARAPQAAEFERLLRTPKKPFSLACGGVAKPTRQWDAPVKQLSVSQLIDQADLADMEGNPIARELMVRMGPSHVHTH
jgi:hypothetical protein